jgi:lysine-N-methylase
MSLPLRHLPLVQNWDCHVCGSCCKEYVVTISDEERRRIEAQGWDKDADVGGMPLFGKSGPWWRRRYHLNHRADGSCIFLSDQGRCRVHERFGYEAKPLPCRLFPFLLVPAGDHWRVGMRFACPSAAANKGRSVRDHEQALRRFAAELVKREGMDRQPGAANVPPPPLAAGQRAAWPDVLQFMQALLTILRDRKDPVERRLRKCLALSNLCRQARFDEVTGKRLGEFLQVVASGLDEEVVREPAAVPPPGWMGRILFRQALALFTRKDHGPDRGIARRGRLALLGAAWRFVRGSGPVPRLHAKIPDTTFEKVANTVCVLPEAAEEVLERYYTVKVESLQFCGPTNFHLSFWDGFDVLALTYPIIRWVAKALADLPPVEAVERALTIVDDHFGYNRILGSRRQRISFRILARTGELPKLIAWSASKRKPVSFQIDVATCAGDR